MAPKRALPSLDDGGELSRPRKRWRSVVMEIRYRRRFTHGFFCFQGIRRGEFTSMLRQQLGSMISRVVAEEVQKAIYNYNQYTAPPPRLLPDQNQQPRYRLVFMNKLTGAFTMMRIETALKVAIVDRNQNVVMFSHLSSVKVEIVVLHGHFNAKDEENWSIEEFNKHIVRGRGNSLLTGDLVLKLNNGETSLDNITFTDNSSFTSTKKFRLGVRLVRPVGERVLEGITAPFKVKERRVEGAKKHESPSLDDKVWRLKKIAKNGVYHQALSDHGIETVQKLLQSYVKDEEKLLRIFDKMPKSTWKDIISHAKKCVFGDFLYSYQPAGTDVILFFNSIYELVGVKFGVCYKAVSQLDPFEKDLVEKLKLVAYEKMDGAHYDHKMVNNFPVPLHTNAGIFAGSSSCSTHMHPSDVQIQNYSQEAGPSNQQHASSVNNAPYYSSSLGGISIGQGFQAAQNYSSFQELSHASWEMSRLVQHPNANSVQLNHQMIPNITIPHHSDHCASFLGSQSLQLHNSNPQRIDFGQNPAPAVVHDKIFSSFFQEPYYGVSIGEDNLPTTDMVISRTNSFDSDTCDERVRRFLAQMPNNQYQDSSFCLGIEPEVTVKLTGAGELSRAAPPLSPRKWVKIKAALKWASIKRLSVSRKSRFPLARQRLVPTV